VRIITSMKILAIETSCDETSIALLECSGNLNNPTCTTLRHSLNSQIDLHREYGGVYPTLAKREHSKNILPLLIQVLGEEVSKNINKLSKDQISKISDILERQNDLLTQFLKIIPHLPIPDIDAIAVTTGPGLAPALWVGVNFAQALSYAWSKKIIPINHMEGHIFSVLIDREDNQNAKSQSPTKKQLLVFPTIALLISGGHTQLVLVKNWGEYEIIGETRDDAVGEAFDKVARMLDLPYPGGPEISRLASQSRNKSEIPNIKLPRPMLNSDNLDFSFSGLKTAVLYSIKGRILPIEEKEEIAREFEDAVTEILIKKTRKALTQYNTSTLIVGGGVIANTHIRKALIELSNELNITLHIPHHDLTGDNAIMIGMAGYIHTQLPNPAEITADNIKADSNKRLN